MSPSGRVPPARTLNLDLGNMAELHMLAINPAHITHVRLTGTQHGLNRKMEIFLVSGESVTTSFDEPDQAEVVFTEVVRAMHRSIALHPDHD